MLSTPAGPAPQSAAGCFSALDLLRSLVGLRDRDPAFITANRAVLDEFAAEGLSLEDSLWQVAREIAAAEMIEIGAGAITEGALA
jgi:hypothetical protein